MHDDDTIAAVATATGRGAIGVVRVSGPAVRHIISELVGISPKPRLAMPASFLGQDGAAIDSGLVLYFPQPHFWFQVEVKFLVTSGKIFPTSNLMSSTFWLRGL